MYTPQSPRWTNDDSTPLSPTRMNYMEDGIAALGELTTYTPTVSGFTLGNGLRDASYAQIGNLVFLIVRLQLGSTSAVSGDIVISLPVNAAIRKAIAQSVLLVDSGTANYPGFAVLGTTTVTVRPSVASGTYSIANASMNSTTPFSWTTPDEIVLGLVYVGG